MAPFLTYRIADGFHRAQVLPTPSGATLKNDWTLGLQRWQTVEIEMEGLSAIEQRVARSPLLVQMHDDRRYGDVQGTQLRDRGHGISRWRYEVNAGEWHAVAPDGLFAGLDQPLLVEEGRETQKFVLER